ncbi:nucleotidyltransferase domain-containing protein [Pseudomonas sp. COR18]|uniref:nucleotidyltransferase domain-containing protein n=1 Tax=Pseudomonas sp. COR18 TaxID=3399680 RepID=UPI003AFFD011
MRNPTETLNIPFLLAELEFNCLTHHVYLTGSLVDGYANAGSDIDLFVIGEQSNNRSSAQYSKTQQRWLDVRYLTEGDILSLKQQVEVNEKLPRHWGEHNIANLDRLETYHRLANATPLTTQSHSTAIHRLVDRSRLKFEAAITHLIIARARWEDAAGSLVSEDIQQCAFVAEIGLWHALDSIAALQGLTNPSSKWRLKKMAQMHMDAPWFNNAKDYFLHDRPSGFSSLKPLLLLGPLIYQVTHYLYAGNFDNTLPDCQPGERVEVDSQGLVFIGAGTRARRPENTAERPNH